MIVHDIGEYQTLRVPWPTPDRADLHLAEDLERGGRLAKLRWLHNGHAEITTTAWVGVIQFHHCTVNVVPKAAGGNLAVLEMLDYASGINALRELRAHRRIDAHGVHLRDLVCLMLARDSDEILRQGPSRNYVTREHALPTLRGRVLADRQIRRRFGQLDQLECRYDELETDHLDNQLLAAGLNVAARIASAADVRMLARRVAADFSGLCDPADLDPNDVTTRLHYTRHNEHYRSAHSWSILLLQAAAVTDMYGGGQSRCPVFLLDMNRLFEDFTTRLVEDALSGRDVQVRPQARHRSVLLDETTGRSHGSVIPDLLLARGTGRRAWRRAVDAKYKLYSERNLDPSDIYQTFLYAQALSRSGSDDQPPTAIIIHPGTPGASHRLVIRNSEGQYAARIRTLALDIPAALDAFSDRHTRDALHTQLEYELTA
ncbi:McrC family protein [Krasilnikovia sp. MM14-A1004]|uniref:McrC family protein n=1 Tax=Krasilnikovia sp. MM14-A1004 TaxID=3373541 RepID=UPI00399D4D29